MNLTLKNIQAVKKFTPIQFDKILTRLEQRGETEKYDMYKRLQDPKELERIE